MTINKMFRDTVQKHGSKPALSSKIDGKYQSISYAELENQVMKFALGLIELGISKGDRIAILSENRPEWAIADLAILAVGAVTVPIYSTLTPTQLKYIVKDSASSIICVSGKKLLAKVDKIRSEFPELKFVIIFDGNSEKKPDNFLTFEEVSDRGKASVNSDNSYKYLSSAVSSDDLATIIYTSGTTGDPKGAMLTHGNFTSNVQAGLKAFEITSKDRLLSFLPLSHVFERTAGYYIAIGSGAEIAYAESPFTVAQNMREACPTVMASVPRLYETIHDKIIKSVRKSKPIRQKIFNWAISVGREASQLKQHKKPLNPILSLKMSMADRLVFRKIRSATGGNLRFFVSGGAPLPLEIAEFFHAIGILILEAYGLTETSPGISANRVDRFKFGTVGFPLDGIEVKIAEEGEILSRGAHIMKGYFNKPSETAEAIDGDGWFHTGDIGEIDADGFLKITDRKKNIIVLSNGKNVAPQPIESAIKRSLYIEQVMLLGDNRKSISALVVPNFELLEDYAAEENLQFSDRSELVEVEEIQKFIRTEIDRFCTGLADFEQVKMFKLLTDLFSQENEQLTPTLKLKRKTILEHYRDEIMQLYGN